jgi:hypothetical protein
MNSRKKAMFDRILCAVGCILSFITIVLTCILMYFLIRLIPCTEITDEDRKITDYEDRSFGYYEESMRFDR